MILTVHGDRTFRTINLHKEFFEPIKTRVGKSQKILLPSEKAEQIGNDIYGRQFRGHILEENGKIISNTLENKETKHFGTGESGKKNVKTENNSKSLSKGFKFKR